MNTHLPRDEALDGKGQQDRSAEHDPREVHQVVVPAVVLHQITLDVSGERGVADDPESGRDQERGEQRPVGDHVPLLLSRSLYGLVDKERIMVAHKGERHNSDGGHYAGEVREPPAVLLAWPGSRCNLIKYSIESHAGVPQAGS